MIIGSAKDLLKNYSKFFLKTSDGESLFYPWMYPGESFLIDAKSKPLLFCMVYGFYISGLACLGLVTLALSNGMINAPESITLCLSLMNVHILLYIYCVFRFAKMGKIYAHENQKPIKIFIFTFIITYYQIDFLFIHFRETNLSNPLELFLTILLAVSTAFSIFMLYRILRTRGYPIERGLK